MKQRLSLGLVTQIVVIAFATLGLFRPGLAGEIEEIEAANTKWVDAFAKRDFHAVQSVMTADSLLMSPNTPAVKGSDAVIEVWKSWAELAGVDVKWGGNQIEVASSGDLAYAEGWYTFSFDTDNGRYEDVGKYIVIWKNMEGSWKVAADIFNSDVPLSDD